MDQLVHDICMQNLPVILAIDRSGLVGEDGETHHGILDVSWCRSIPNLTIMAPRDIPDLKSMYEGAARIMSPCAIRLPRGNAPGAEFRDKRRITAPWGKGEKLFEGSGWALCAYGSTVPLARIVYEEALREGLQPPSIYDLRFLKPMDMDMVREMLTSHDSVIVLEDGHREGGAGEKISAIATEGPYRSRVITMGVPDEFVPHGTVGEQWKYCGLEPEEVIRKYHAITSERTAGPGNGKKRSCGEPDSRAVNDNGWGRGC
jgi:1-deoxy-D-xylulose-5-phosphate synthase